jgi:hypothetical protein
MEIIMHDQVFWTADLSAFSPFQRVSSVIVSALIVGGILFGLFATTAGIA